MWDLPDAAYLGTAERTYDVYRLKSAQSGMVDFLGSTSELYFEDMTAEPGVTNTYTVVARQSDGKRSDYVNTMGRRAARRFIEPASLVVDKDEECVNVELLCSGAWHILNKGEWLSVMSPTSGIGRTNVEIRARGNDEPYSREDIVAVEFNEGDEIVRDFVAVRQKGICKDVVSMEIECRDMMLSGERFPINSRLRYDDGSSVVLSEVCNRSNGYEGDGVEYYVLKGPIGTKAGGGVISIPSVKSPTEIEIGALYEEYGVTNAARKSVKVIPRPTLTSAAGAPFELSCYDVTGIEGWTPTVADAHEGGTAIRCGRPSILKTQVDRGEVSFWCKLSPEFVKLSGIYGQYLTVSVNGKVVRTLSYEDAAEWTKISILVPEDNSTVTWTYCSVGAGLSAGVAYLDSFAHSPLSLTAIMIDGVQEIMSLASPRKTAPGLAEYHALACYNDMTNQWIAIDDIHWSVTGVGASFVGGDAGGECVLAAEAVTSNQTVRLSARTGADGEIGAEKDILVQYVEREYDFAEALDCHTLTFGQGGKDSWCGVKSSYKIGESSARSDLSGTTTNALIKTSVPWGGALGFWWKCKGGALSLVVDGKVLKTLSTSDWAYVRIDLENAPHEIQWVHSSSGGRVDVAWLDGVTWEQVSQQICGIQIVTAKDALSVGESTKLYCRVSYDYGADGLLSPDWSIVGGADHAGMVQNVFSALSAGAVTVRATVEVDGSTYTATRRFEIVGSDADLATSVGCAKLLFETGGDAVWHHQTATYYDAGGSAQSGDVGGGGTSWMRTTVQGPCKLTFYWKNDSWGEGDELNLIVDGTLWNKTGGTSWKQVSVNLGEERAYEIRWSYTINSMTTIGLRHGWVDRVRIEELDAPTSLRSISIEGQEQVLDTRISDFRCYAKYDNGQKVKVDPTWSIVEGNDFCNIDSKGYLWAWGAGNARIKATYSWGGRSCTAYFDLKVLKTLTKLQISGPQTLSEGSHRKYECCATYSDGTEKLVDAEWSIASVYRANDPTTNGFARLDADGTLYACTNDVGNVVVRAVYADSGIVLTNEMKVGVSRPEIVSLKIQGDSVVRFGTPEQYKAVMTFGEDALQAVVTPTWNLMEGAECASLSSAGVLTPKSTGNARIRAFLKYGKLMIEYKDIDIVANGTDRGGLKSIYINGPSSVEFGHDAQCRCFGVYENGAVASVDADWQVSNCGTNAWVSGEGILRSAPLQGCTMSALLKATVGELSAYSTVRLDVHYDEMTIGRALDASLQYDRTDPTNWFGQSVYSADGVGAVRTRLNTSVKMSSITSAVQGPGTLVFKWSQKAQTAYRRVLFLVDGMQVAKLEKSNDYGWQSVEQSLADGVHVLEWRYENDSGKNETDWFVIDEVSWIKEAAFVGLAIEGDDIVLAGKVTTNSCVAVYDDGSIVTNKTASWSVKSGNDLVQLVDAEGALLAGPRSGLATLEVQCVIDGDRYSAERDVLIQKSAVSLEIVGSSVSGLWASENFACNVVYSDGSKERVWPNWSIESGDADMDSWGYLTPYGRGVVTIRADYDGESEKLQQSHQVEVVTMTDCVNSTNLQGCASGNGVWQPDADVSHDGDLSLRAQSASGLITSTYGSGTLSFWCRQKPGVGGGCVRLLVDDKECASLSDSEEWSYHSVEVMGDGLHYIVWEYESSDDAGALWLDEIAWQASDTIPDLGDNPTTRQISAVLEKSKDSRLAVNITDGTAYGKYRAWVAKVKAKGGTDPVGAEAVKASSNAWLSFALDSETLIENAPDDGDVTIDSFVPTAVGGAFELAVGVAGIYVGEGATAENLAKLFGIEGGEAIDDLSAAKVSVSFGEPAGGKVRLTAGPKDVSSSTFFMRVMMTP